MADEKDFYNNIPFDKKIVDVQFSTEELNILIKLLGFCGNICDMASRQENQDPKSAQIYADHSHVSLGFRKKLLEFAKVGLPPETEKH